MKIQLINGLGWGIKANFPQVGFGTSGTFPACKSFLRILTRINANFGEITENSQKPQPEIEPGTSQLSVFRTEPHSHWWDATNKYA